MTDTRWHKRLTSERSFRTLLTFIVLNWTTGLHHQPLLNLDGKETDGAFSVSKGQQLHRLSGNCAPELVPGPHLSSDMMSPSHSFSLPWWLTLQPYIMGNDTSWQEAHGSHGAFLLSVREGRMNRKPRFWAPAMKVATTKACHLPPPQKKKPNKQKNKKNPTCWQCTTKSIQAPTIECLALVPLFFPGSYTSFLTVWQCSLTSQESATGAKQTAAESKQEHTLSTDCKHC